MAMKVGSTDGDMHSDINTTPLIDVMLVLLVMLIITIPPQRQAVEIDNPVPCATCEAVAAVNPVRISVDFDGAVYWNGARVDLGAIDGLMRAEAARADQPEIHVEPHQRAGYGEVAAVMAAAQRAGLSKLAVIGGA
jgi:biopolymer transport protein ExbD